MANSEPQAPPQQTHTIQVKYNDLTARYANHVLVNVGAEEVYLDFTSGVVAERPGSSVMPVHTRIAMTPAGVVRLAQLLNQTVQNFQVVQVPPAQPQPAPPNPASPAGPAQ
jgi:hypothetical protein